MPFLLDRQTDLERELERVLVNLPQPHGASSRQVRNLVRYVHAHLFDAGLNVAVARNECGLRDNNASSLFRHEVGCSIKDYIDSLRMEAASRLLQHRRFSVFDIGQSLGYTHPQTFYRVYRRYFGGAPASMRPSLTSANQPVLNMPGTKSA
jgi:two-component system response regulator YesN